MKYIFDEPTLNQLRDGDMSLADWQKHIESLITKYGAKVRMKTDSGLNTTSFRITLPE